MSKPEGGMSCIQLDVFTVYLVCIASVIIPGILFGLVTNLLICHDHCGQKDLEFTMKEKMNFPGSMNQTYPVMATRGHGTQAWPPIAPYMSPKQRTQ